MLDYHVHLWPHPEVADESVLSLEGIARFAERVPLGGEIALTEHLFRFRQGAAAVGEFWESEPDEALRASMAAYFAHHATADLDRYVEAVTAAREAGLPVRLGLEVDYYAGRMSDVAELLARYPFDVLLGSVHWLGAWRFDDLDDAASQAVWSRRRPEEVWLEYTAAIEELARSGACDVLAHVDLAKVTGVRPAPEVLEECHRRIAAVVAATGITVEVSSAGWRKPVGEAYPAPELLARLARHGTAFTTASDAHGAELVGDRFEDAAALLEGVGVGALRGFRERRPRELPLRRVAPR